MVWLDEQSQLSSPYGYLELYFQILSSLWYLISTPPCKQGCSENETRDVWYTLVHHDSSSLHFLLKVIGLGTCCLCVVRLGRPCAGDERDGRALTCIACPNCVGHASDDLVHPWSPLPQSAAHTQTHLCPVYLSFRASELSEFVCMFSLLCHCIAPPLNLEIQSMLKLDKKWARNSEKLCVFFTEVSWEFRCSFS